MLQSSLVVLYQKVLDESGGMIRYSQVDYVTGQWILLAHDGRSLATGASSSKEYRYCTMIGDTELFW